MKLYFTTLCLLAFLGLSPALLAQQEVDCNPSTIGSGELTINYGSTVNGFAATTRSNVTYGQPVVGSTAYSSENAASFGVFSLFLMPPRAPSVMATQGDFPNRVQLSWKPNPLGSQPTEGYIITRDGSYLTTVDADETQFLDFNVQAGEFYEYAVSGKNGFGKGVSGRSVGFVNPNGVVSGKIQTSNGNPVPGAIVTLTPTIGQSLSFGGEGENICISYDEALPTDMFTVSTWVKIGASHDSDGIIDLGSDLNKNFWIHTTPSNMGKGVVAGVGDGTAHEMAYEFEDDPNTVSTDERDEWHHVAVVYGGGSMILYVDGKFKRSIQAAIVNEPALFSIGSRRDQSGFFEGILDDIRIYNRLLTQTEIVSTKDITANKFTEGLVGYWKFDEGLGTKVFDLSNTGMDGNLNGATFSYDTPDILNGGITDGTGFYFMEGINYSQEQSFTARPSKLFYNNYALEFNAAYESSAVLTNFGLSDTSHIEVTVHPFDLNSTQSILSKVEGGSDAFNLFLENGKYKLTVNGETQELGDAATEYQHLALSLNSTAGTVTFYLNGNEEGSLSYGNLAGSWQAEAWQVGARDITTPTDFFTGLVDEVAFYADSLLTLQEIQLHATAFGDGGTDVGHGSLTSYFNFNESEGTELFDSGPAATGVGENKGASFSFITLRQEEFPHEFEPNTRFVNINNTSTAVSDVDFTDISTVPISGVIRFQNTFCFQDSVEILVNGAPYFPPIFTNEEGRFVADFEPGANVVLTPKFGTDSTAHNFFPGFFEARKLNTPIANVLFQNTTKREIEGQLFGGHCRMSVIAEDGNGDPAAIVKVKLAALNGCYEEELQLQTVDGKFKFDNIPPIPVAVSVTEHSNSIIYDYFQIQGGKEVDLRSVRKDTVDFMYISPPNVELGEINDGLLANECNLPLIKDSQSPEFSVPKLYSNNIRVYQPYDGGRCYLDTFDLVINNGIQETMQEEFKSDSSTYVYEWYANNPNLLAPHTKPLQVVAKVGTQTASASYEAIVLGERQQEGTITTTGPSEVFAVVHDPPGDGSFATWSESTKTCTTWEDATVNTTSGSAEVKLRLGPKKEIVVGTPFISVGQKFEVFNDTRISGSFESINTINNTGEFCFEVVQEISTSDGDDIWGDYGDVYFGASINFEIGARDILDYDFDNCQFTNDVVLSVSPNGFETDFVFSRWQIETEIIPQLQEIIDQGVGQGITQEQWEMAIASRKKWIQTLAQTQIAKREAEYDRNITFDAATSYTETVTTEQSGNRTFSTTLGRAGEIGTEFGVVIGGLGTTWDLSIGYSRETTSSSGSSQSNSLTTSFTLADDDLNDFYSIDIADNYSQLTLENKSEYYELIMDIAGENNPLQAESQFDFSPASTPFSHTPIFRLVGGESMCPWIPGTRNREEVFVQVAEPVQTNVPDNTAAIYNVTLGSIGPNGVDGLVYQLGVRAEGNPNGALISIDGQELVGLGGTAEFQFVGTESIQKQIAVEVGTSTDFNFEGLGLYFGSTCQIDHALSVGYDPSDINGGFLIYDNFSNYGESDIYTDEGDVNWPNGGTGEDYYRRFYKEFELTAQFIEPCSPIDISFPLQNHVVTPGNENLFVTLSEYDNEDPDLDIVRLQYRPIPGDGSWVNILELPADSFANDPVFKIVQWDMMELKDGAYELRAIADCGGTIGGDLSPGISEVIRVVKETEAPELFGAPQPADGILSRGDEISITFNEPINCNKVFDADGIGTNINLNNIALIDTETGALVPFSSQCVGDKIIITPEIQSRFINGKTLRAIATDIEDLAGNPMEVPIGAPGSPTVNFESWEFLVDLNPLRWTAGSDIDEVVNEGNGLVVTRDIVNQSGTPMNFSITGPRIDNPDGSVTYGSIPAWVTIAPTDGTLDPGEQEEITFVFADNLPQNEYATQVNVVGTDGNKDIDVDLRVACEGPGWEINPGSFAYSMTMTAELNIEGEVSTDNLDLIGAFVGSELRGVAAVEYVAEIDKYLAFLTIYSNNLVGETVTFQIWDARECTLYGSTNESFDFVADDLIGSPIVPQAIHTNNLLLRKIPIFPGWNWISY
ncbi:LamG-like jellyroll fold domain-containing protein, partial [Phaeodactylibacter xiamenensis]|uniref:LamG-like jellyroll fold domain-containing protein n=1 Tax=Phaeodactylibacter xiamenensis TaxID=1524460 RepID=UPI0024A91E03